MHPLNALIPLPLFFQGFLGAPAPSDLDAASCELRLASGEHSLASAMCPTLTDWAALAAADAAEQAALVAPAPKGTKPGAVARPVVAWMTASEAVERARQAHAGGIIEEAWTIDLLARLSAAAETGKGKTTGSLPTGGRWPLPGARIPAPALPPLTDENLRQATDSLNRATERLRTLRARVAIDASEPLRLAAERAVGERRLLLEKVAAALEDALEKDPKFTKLAWLHLAGTYFELDHLLPPAQRHARGLAMLERLRKTTPDETSASLAGLWLAGFALNEGDVRKTRALLDEGATLDSGLAALYEAILAFSRGEVEAARQRLPEATRHADPAARAQAQALTALLLAKDKPVESAQAWESCAAALDDAEAPASALRARLRAGVAWTTAVQASTAATLVPPEHRSHVLRLLVQRGDRVRSDQVALAALEAEPTQLGPVFDALALIDVHLGAGDEPASDSLLADVARRVVGEGPFSKAHAKSPVAVSLRDAIRDRLMARVTAPLASGRVLDDETRTRLGPLVEARLTLFPPGAADQISTARALAVAGFGDRAATIVKKVRDEDPDAARRQEAAVALVELSLVRARVAGQSGEAVGPFLDGPPARAPMSASVRALLDAQTALLASLKTNDARDQLFCDHAAVRIAFGQGAELTDGLQDVIARREHEPAGLRAGLLLIQGGTPDTRARDAVLLARKRLGPPERENLLRAFVVRAMEPLKATVDNAAFSQRLYDRAALGFDTFANQAKTPAARDAAWAAAAATWALALRVPEAVAGYRAFLASAPDHALAAEARTLLAGLLLEAGDRVAAAATYEEVALKDPSRAADTLATLASLYATAPARLRVVLERLVRDFPDRVPDAAAQLARLTPQTAPSPSTSPPGASVERFFARGLR